MNNEIKQDLKVIYTKELMDYDINVYGTEEDPLFLLKDVCIWLGYSDNTNISKIGNMVDEDEKLICPTQVGQQRRNVLFVTEDGLYEICMRSQTDKAKKVRKFIKGILKELRTKGFVSTNNNSEIANAMNIIAQTLMPMQEAIISIKEENDRFKEVLLESHYELEGKTLAMEKALGFIRIDSYELKAITLAAKEKRDRQDKYFKILAKKYDVSPGQISRIWDYILYQGMYEYIGRERLTPFADKRLYNNQSIKDINKSEYPKAIEYIDSFVLDKKDFEDRVHSNYKKYLIKEKNND